MAIRSLKSGTFSRSTMVGNPIIMPGSYESIASATGNGSSGTITFSSIPSTYTHLQIRASLKLNAGADISLTINSGSFARRHYLYGNGSAAFSGTDTANALLSFSSTANIFASNIIDILDYTNTNKAKTYRNLSGVDFNGSGSLIMYSGLDTSTAAITSITLTCSNPFSQYSSFALYGVN